MTRKREPRFVPERPIPEPGEWGLVAVDSVGGLDARLATAIERLDAAIEAMLDAGRAYPQGSCWARHPREARHDAIGFWRSSGGERLIHRYAGLSKLNPPIDPFRPHGQVDDAIRCETGIMEGKPNTNPVRCEVVHEGSHGSTLVTVTTGGGHTPYAPWHEHSAHRAAILLRTARSVLSALVEKGSGTEDFHQDCICQAVIVLDAADAAGAVLAGRCGVDVHAASPIARASIRPNWQRDTFDPARANLRPLVLPPAVGLSLWTAAAETRISVHPAAFGVRFAQIDAMTRLRATARIAERGYDSGDVE